MPVPPLVHGARYYTAVLATDHAGLSVNCSSDGFVADLTPPVAGFLVVEQVSSDLVGFEWAGFSDAESGIQEYQVALGTPTSPEAAVEYRFVGLSS